MPAVDQYAVLAQRVRWAYESVSEVATSLLEAERTKLSAQAFDCELQLACLYNEVLELLRKSPPLRPRKDASSSRGDQLPF